MSIALMFAVTLNYRNIILKKVKDISTSIDRALRWLRSRASKIWKRASLVTEPLCPASGTASRRAPARAPRSTRGPPPMAPRVPES